jgi:LuxR family maltose regulon positive regulatory protein
MAPASRLAKLSVPRTSGALVRARLHRVLDEAMQCAGAAWIAAGPGAGKSTLAAAWASARPGRVLWYRADEGDADPAAPFAYFQTLAGSTQRARALPRYTARELDRLDLFARTFFRAFFAVVPAAPTLVIDDAHAVGAETFSALLAAAVREAPQDVALLILSRQDPAGAVLEPIAAGALQVIDAAALAFTADEAANLLGGRMDAAAARRLHARTDGWAAGMLLLAQSQGADADTRSSDRIASYFDDRVLAAFHERELKTLAAVSLLPEIDVDDLARMGLADGAADLLERTRGSTTSRIADSRPSRLPATFRGTSSKASCAREAVRSPPT